MDMYDVPVPVKTAVMDILGWPEKTYRKIVREVNHGINPPPIRRDLGGTRNLVTAREVKEWYDRVTRVER